MPMKPPMCKHGNTDECLPCYDEEIARLRKIEHAAKTLVAQKGRHNTEIAYKRLVDALTHNVELTGGRSEG